MKKLAVILICILGLSGCAKYKQHWSCPNAEGIGCSSVEYADEVARQAIILNQVHVTSKNPKKAKKQKTKVLVNEHEEDFEKQPMIEKEF